MPGRWEIRAESSSNSVREVARRQHTASPGNPTAETLSRQLDALARDREVEVRHCPPATPSATAPLPAALSRLPMLPPR